MCVVGVMCVCVCADGVVCVCVCVCALQVLSGGRLLSLSSSQVSDAGAYTCVAVNSGGEQQREYDLRVHGEL